MLGSNASSLSNLEATESADVVEEAPRIIIEKVPRVEEVPLSVSAVFVAVPVLVLVAALYSYRKLTEANGSSQAVNASWPPPWGAHARRAAWTVLDLIVCIDYLEVWICRQKRP